MMMSHTMMTVMRTVCDHLLQLYYREFLITTTAKKLFQCIQLTFHDVDYQVAQLHIRRHVHACDPPPMSAGILNMSTFSFGVSAPFHHYRTLVFVYLCTPVQDVQYLCTLVTFESLYRDYIVITVLVVLLTCCCWYWCYNEEICNNEEMHANSHRATLRMRSSTSKLLLCEERFFSSWWHQASAKMKKQVIKILHSKCSSQLVPLPPVPRSQDSGRSDECLRSSRL